MHCVSGCGRMPMNDRIEAEETVLEKVAGTIAITLLMLMIWFI